MLSNDSGYWHRRAEEARALTKQMSDEQNRKMMLKIAGAYDGLAVKAAMNSDTGCLRSNHLRRKLGIRGFSR